MVSEGVRASWRFPCSAQATCRWVPTSLGAVRRLVSSGRPSPPAIVLMLAAAYFLLLLWWIGQDDGIPLYDNGSHLAFAFSMSDALRSGDLAMPLGPSTNSPPLVHIVGALTTLIAGPGTDAPVIAIDLLFLPLLFGGV